jgi:hypothetical protein
MAGTKQRYKVQWITKGNLAGDGKIRTVSAQGYKSAKEKFVAVYEPPKGAWLSIWPMGEAWNKREMRVG